MSYDKYFKINKHPNKKITEIWGENDGKYCIVAFWNPFEKEWYSLEYDYVEQTWHDFIPHPEYCITEIPIEETFEIIL